MGLRVKGNAFAFEKKEECVNNESGLDVEKTISCSFPKLAGPTAPWTLPASVMIIV